MAYQPNNPSSTNAPNGGRINFGISGNTTGTTSTPFTVSTGTQFIAAGTNVTLSQNANTINIGMPRPGGTTQLSRWEAPEDVFTPIGAIGQGSLSIQHQYIPFNVSASAAKVAGSITVATQLIGGNNISATFSLWMGMYKLNGSTLNTIGSGSAAINFTGSIGNTTQQTAVSGLRQFTVPMNINITPGEYWMAAVISSSANPAGSVTISMYGNNLVAAGNSSIPFLPIGLNSTQTTGNVGGFIMYQGIHKTAAYTMPTSIVGTQIDNYNASNVQRADYYYALYNQDF